MILAKAMIVNYDRNHNFIVLATVITIVNYDRKTFIVLATDHKVYQHFKQILISQKPITQTL
jgi:hypothetical protein